ncbi:hypothetical protein GCM10012286_83280 [Streptomyces lasiicapitis]|uniref:Uncharacterized protein n=1 Tax=Streptomyces lasiicapitis TaxID=1923961 RepID=A0ABQ2MZ63_9ACTN|nr:hypothetical protein GCM10012286_83280 [Streptomyces lasiicapitis]
MEAALEQPGMLKSLIAAALDLVVACGELDEVQERQEHHPVLHSPDYADDVLRAQHTLTRCPYAHALLGPCTDSRGVRIPRTVMWTKARRAAAALAEQPLLTTRNREAVRHRARIVLGLIHHHLAGAPLPADCQ